MACQPRKSSNHKRVTGFTLLEVLVALAVLALSSLAVLSQAGTSLRQQHQLQQKTVALWVAELKFNQLRIAENWPNIGHSTEYIEFAEDDWQLTTSVVETPEPWLRKVEISVRSEQGDSDILLLTGYLGQY